MHYAQMVNAGMSASKARRTALQLSKRTAGAGSQGAGGRKKKNVIRGSGDPYADALAQATAADVDAMTLRASQAAAASKIDGRRRTKDSGLDQTRPAAGAVPAKSTKATSRHGHRQTEREKDAELDLVRAHLQQQQQQQQSDVKYDDGDEDDDADDRVTGSRQANRFDALVDRPSARSERPIKASKQKARPNAAAPAPEPVKHTTVQRDRNKPIATPPQSYGIRSSSSGEYASASDVVPQRRSSDVPTRSRSSRVDAASSFDIPSSSVDPHRTSLHATHSAVGSQANPARSSYNGSSMRADPGVDMVRGRASFNHGTTAHSSSGVARTSSLRSRSSGPGTAAASSSVRSGSTAQPLHFTARTVPDRLSPVGSSRSGLPYSHQQYEHHPSPAAQTVIASTFPTRVRSQSRDSGPRAPPSGGSSAGAADRRRSPSPSPALSGSRSSSGSILDPSSGVASRSSINQLLRNMSPTSQSYLSPALGGTHGAPLIRSQYDQMSQHASGVSASVHQRPAGNSTAKMGCRFWV